MKKILALVLALTLALSVASVAMAAHVDHDSWCELDPTYGTAGAEDHMQPGETYTILEMTSAAGVMMLDYSAWMNGSVDAVAGDFVDANGMTAMDEDTDISVDWSVGGAMVESVKYEEGDLVGEGELVLKLNENFTIDSLKDLEGTFTFETDDYEWDLDFYAEVSNHLIIVDGYSKVADAADDAIEAEDNTIYKCSEDEPGYIVFNANNRLFSTTLKMVKNEKAFMFNNEEMIEAVEEMYGNLDADIECYQFGGSPTFANDAAFSLQADYADQYYVYEWDGKNLTKVDYEWDSINGLYKWATKSPTDYVISDKELVMADTEEEKNPDTGANDVVGVAAALAVVSLIAAGAVSLKK